MTVEILDRADTLAPAWASLWNERPDATPFQHPAWLLPWWSAFGTEQLRIATWYAGGRLAGVFPAYVLGGTKLLPVGAGTTDMLDVLGEGAAPMVHALLHRAVAERVGRCDLIDVPPGSPLDEVGAPAGWHASWSQGEACPVLRLADIPAGARRKLRMNRNRAARSGGWAVQEEGAAGLGALTALHQARWARDGEAGVLTDPLVLRWHRAALPGLQTAGLLRLCLLRVGGVTAAAILALLSPGRIFFYLSGFDPAFSFVSPGSLLLGAMLEQAADEGRTEAHFLRGREAYKYAWGAQDRFNRTLSFAYTSAEG